MDFPSREILDYCDTVTTPANEWLSKLDRETHLTRLMPQMLSGLHQGTLLKALVAMVNPQKVVEVGTYTGYSAIAMAEVMPVNSELHTIEINPEFEEIIHRYAREAGVSDKIRLHIGDALQILPTLAGPLDFVFLDAKKEDYCVYFDLVIDKVRSGGVILADNVLWSGKVLDPGNDPAALALADYNRKVAGDPRVVSVLIPMRDGLMLSVKR